MSFRATKPFILGSHRYGLFFFPGKQVYSPKYVNPGLALVGIGWIICLDLGAWRCSLCVCCCNAAFMSLASSRWDAPSVLYCGVHTKDTVIGEGRMTVRKAIWECQGVLPFMGWWKKRCSSSLTLPYAICCTTSKPLLVRKERWVASCCFSSHGFEELFLRLACLKPENTHSWGNRKRLFQSKGH